MTTLAEAAILGRYHAANVSSVTSQSVYRVMDDAFVTFGEIPQDLQRQPRVLYHLIDQVFLPSGAVTIVEGQTIMARVSNAAQAIARAPEPEDVRIVESGATGDPLSTPPAWMDRILAEIKALASLPENLAGEGDLIPSVLVANRAKQVLSSFADGQVPPPAVFPTGDGGVYFEWHIRGLDAELEIGADSAVIVYYSDLRSGETWERPLSRSQAELFAIRARLSLR